MMVQFKLIQKSFNLLQEHLRILLICTGGVRENLVIIVLL